MKILILLLASFSVYAQDIPGLHFLKSMKNQQMVAIGESGHAVSGFHHYRAVISKKLIQESGFRNIFVEEDVVSGLKIAKGLVSCTDPSSSPEEFKQAFLNFDPTTYRHQEFFEFYQWLCDWNRSHPKDPVRMYGMDVWSNYWEIRQALEVRMSSVTDQVVKGELADAKESCFLWSLGSLADYVNHPDWAYWNRYKRIEPSRNGKCLASLQSLKEKLPGIRNTLPKATYDEITLLVDNGMTQQLVRDVYTFDFSKAMNLRDSFQARATLFFLNSFELF